MRATWLKRLLLSRWRLHTVCALLSLIACIPILWPRLLTEDVEGVLPYAGLMLFCVFSASAAFMVLAEVHMLLRLRNRKALFYILSWCSVWALACGVFVLMAIAADVPPLPVQEGPQPIQQTDTLSPANEELTGPSALVIPITPESFSDSVVEDTPNLRVLEALHDRVLTDFLEASPRWAAQSDDTFYSRPGHVVMVPPVTGGTPGLVHVCFRRLVEGEPLPQGYLVVKSGEPFPKAPAGKQVPDIALDLGRNHFLLLAWRGTTHKTTAHKALNAAIAAVDSRMQGLADSPTRETAAALNLGKLNMTGHTPELRLCEPPAQFGAYQAEIYANPHEPGTLLVYIRDLETNSTLRILNCPAQYSENPNELFRHDLPGSIPPWMRGGEFSDLHHLFAPGVPLFAIREGEPHKYFGVAFEVRFKPIDPRKPSRLILRRCYTVEAYEKPTPGEPTPAATKRTPDELTPPAIKPESATAEEPANEPQPPAPSPTPAENTDEEQKPAVKPAPELQTGGDTPEPQASDISKGPEGEAATAPLPEEASEQT